MAEYPASFAARAIITWPQADNGAVQSWGIRIDDADTGEPIMSVRKLALVLADPVHPVWARVTAYTGKDGQFIHSMMESWTEDGVPCEAEFDLHIVEMRIAGDARTINQHRTALGLDRIELADAAAQPT